MYFYALGACLVNKFFCLFSLIALFLEIRVKRCTSQLRRAVFKPELKQSRAAARIVRGDRKVHELGEQERAPPFVHCPPAGSC
jgi:hypothetical protein